MTTEMVDWSLAVSMGSWLAGAGPQVSEDEAAETVAELRAGAERSTSYVHEFTGLDAGDLTAPVLVVDRAAWVRANADGFAKLLSPVIDKVAERKGPPGPVTQAVGSRITGAEVGGLLGFMASKVLGQFDPFHDPHGRLLLIAPNVVHVERELGADPRDFRLWVCLHEETHRVQFTAVPWMRDHLFAEFNALAGTVEPQRFLDEGLKRISEAIKNGRGGSLLDVLGSPEQKEILDRVTAVMSLLEGHADFVMDGVGPSVIPTVTEIRGSFNERRKGVGTLDRLLRKLLGLEAKMAQYRDGSRFVRAVVEKTGMAEFNAVWATSENLPTLTEIHDPDRWIARVHRA
ncbi:MAG TPA: zinc-dependent metalloprotease [Nocardioides sp.]|nr:zinc-dependent metalloprotease [Nocardioides sp.]